MKIVQGRTCICVILSIDNLLAIFHLQTGMCISETSLRALFVSNILLSNLMVPVSSSLKIKVNLTNMKNCTSHTGLKTMASEHTVIRALKLKMLDLKNALICNRPLAN